MGACNCLASNPVNQSEQIIDDLDLLNARGLKGKLGKISIIPENQ
jgi:hypothetical protein